VPLSIDGFQSFKRKIESFVKTHENHRLWRIENQAITVSGYSLFMCRDTYKYIYLFPFSSFFLFCFTLCFDEIVTGWDWDPPLSMACVRSLEREVSFWVGLYSSNSLWFLNRHLVVLEGLKKGHVLVLSCSHWRMCPIPLRCVYVLI